MLTLESLSSSLFRTYSWIMLHSSAQHGTVAGQEAAAALGRLLYEQPCRQSVKTGTRKRAYQELASPALQTLSRVLHAQAYGTLSTAVKKALYDQ